MNHINYFKELFGSIPDYRKVVLLIILFKNDKSLLKEIGFSENDITVINLEFKNTSTEQHEDYLDYIKNEEDLFRKRF